MSSIYRCFFWNQDHKISSAQNFGADGDAEAIVAAKEMAVLKKAPAFELWLGMRLVHREG
jgi:hypothetical protein